MKWTGRRESSNVDDRRGVSGGKLAAGGGIAGLIGTAFEDQSKTISVHTNVKGDKAGLIEGMNVTAIISIGESLAAAVPDDAIVNYQGKDYIFMKTESKEGVSFKRFEVVKGVSDLGYSEIKPLEEMPVNAQIAIKGTFFLLAKMTNAGEEE